MEQTPIKAVLFDWAGTTVDFGSRAPTQVFVEIFGQRGVEITGDEARGPMGRAKHEHIAMIAALPRVSTAWRKLHGHPATESDVRRMYEDFLPLQTRVLAEGSAVIPGIPAAVAELRSRGLKIGSTTGYTRELMSVVVPLAASQGYEPDVTVCSDDVSQGRPAPWMNLRAASMLNVYPLNRIVAVDDTPVGIEAGKNAGMITVAVSLTGNAMGLSESEINQLPEAELERRIGEIERQFITAGADYVIRSVADLPPLLNRLS
ncbi:MAG: phosphonoacetaldehyde hydrolase [Planctomycetaceae bacterium]